MTKFSAEVFSCERTFAGVCGVGGENSEKQTFHDSSGENQREISFFVESDENLCFSW